MTRPPRLIPPAIDPKLASELDERLGVPSAGDAELIARVQARVMAAVRQEAKPVFATVRASDDGWDEIAPGITRKTLWMSAGARSCMIRMLPGSVVGTHAHSMDEECVVLEGTLRIGSDLVLHAGDFHVGSRGTVHSEASTETGALVYLRGEMEAA